MTNKELTKVSGNVEAVSDKYNGSVKINGTWYAYHRDFDGVGAEQGQNVELSLESWEAKGKKGFNIVGVDFTKTAAVKRPATVVESTPSASLGRDFDKENRGKVRHGLMVALAPLVATDSLELDAAKELIIQMTEFVMSGK